MAQRGRMTFQKRQKEMARKERQRMKVERRVQRKAAGGLERAEQLWDQNSTSESEMQETMEQVPGVEGGSSASGSETRETMEQAQGLEGGSSTSGSETAATEADSS